jgi:Peptidase S24-like
MEKTNFEQHLDSGAVRSALVAEVLKRESFISSDPLKSVRMRVQGESMLPALWPGDIVEIAPCTISGLRAGEIVLAWRDGRLFLHRFVSRCDSGGFLLCGDSLQSPDRRFPQEALLGRLVCRVSGGRARFKSTLRPGFAAKCSRTFGILLCYWGLARRVALRLHTPRTVSIRGSRETKSRVLGLADLGSAEQ